ncbi:hypothetical protein JHN53_17135 [Streptomyces sp. MBT58]|uniref:hypothetical protein n=1 Tax=Streptomyces sp. MBT58 TaxID=1488389 RepID=UPI00191175D2|nr:hypothetical protein [Streptomyces sp. MBT58]MBK5993335.1 hypothetical protein [Streptomyces sp. MBT58]
MGMIFGFSDDGALAPVPEEVRGQVESTVTLSGGQTHTDASGNTYTTTGSGEGESADR